MKKKLLLIAFVLGFLCLSRPAQAAIVMTLEQVGSNVVATGSGTADLTDLTSSMIGQTNGYIYAAAAILLEGDGDDLRPYSGITGPGKFGTGSLTYVTSGSGDPLGIAGGSSAIAVPAGYVSGTLLSGTATWDNTTLSALGVTTGVYTWTWGSGADADSLTLYAGVPAPTAVPEPAPVALLALAAALPLFSVTRQRRKS